MKTGLLIFLLMASVNVVFSQPCVIESKINNGGGNCPDLDGYQATGSVTLTFNGTITTSLIPRIVRVDSLPGGTVPGVFFGPGKLNNNGTVTYCYYLGPNNTNNLRGRGINYTFIISYSSIGIVPCGTSNIPLPVHFKSFNVARSGSKVIVKWETASEQNNSGFAVERNVNGSWSQVAFVPSQSVTGNSDELLSYQFDDLNTIKGITQYRIRQVDLDSKSKYSEVRSVRGEGQSGKMIVYPNPSTDGRVNVVFDDKEGNRNVVLLDMAGRTIRQWQNISTNTIYIDNLRPGIYSLRIVISATREQSFKKIVVAGVQ